MSTSRRNKLGNRLRKLRAEVLEDRHMLAAVTWDGGGGDLDWGNAANWDDAGVDRLPGPGDDVLISDVTDVVIDQTELITINSLYLRRGSINTTGSSQFVIEGWLNLENFEIMVMNGGGLEIDTPDLIGLNMSIQADGADSFVSLTSVEYLPGMRVTATNGAAISLPDITDSDFFVKLNASGGSRFSLGTSGPATTTIQGEVLLDDSEVFGDGLEIDRLSGNGTIHGDLTVIAEIRPDGPLSVTGDLRSSLDRETTMVVEFASLSEITTLSVDGTASLSGFVLQVEFGRGYFPSIGDAFDFLNATSVIGDFLRVNPSALNNTFTTSVSEGVVTATTISDLGPRVTSIEVSSLSESLTSITVNLSKAVTTASVTQNAVALDRNNEPVTEFTVTHSASFPNKFKIDFDAPLPAGEFRLSIDPVIAQINGNLMDQDGDGVLGEAIDDVYVTEFLVEDNDGPVVRSVEELAFGRGPISELRVVFSTATDVNSFTSEDVRVFNSSDLEVDVQPVIEPQDSLGTTYDITFENPVVEDGKYEILIGPDIFDVNGNAIDQNEDGVFGDPLLDTFVFEAEVKVADPIPATPGNGAFTELFLGIDESFDLLATESAALIDRSPDATGVVPALDFPNTGRVVSTRDDATFDEFFSGTFPLTEERQTEVAGTFMLRNTFYLAIPADADLIPSTPAIDVQTGVGSDDGYILRIDDELISQSSDRAWRYTWDNVAFPSPGIYPIELVYSANDSGQSGLEFALQTATNRGEIVPTEQLYFDSSLLFAGDANLNGTVNSADLGLLLNNFNDDSGLGWESGNFNDDLFVDGTDLGLLLNNFNSDAALATAAFAELDAEKGSNERLYTPLDALRIINHLKDPHALTAHEFNTLDFDGDGEIVPRDALIVINRLNVQRSSPISAKEESWRVRDIAIQEIGELNEQEWTITGPKLNWIP